MKATVGVLVALLMSLSACSSDGSSDKTPASASGSPSADNYLEVPAGVSLTLRGTKAELGDQATVAWQPAANQTAVLDLTVTSAKSVSLAKLKSWTLDAKTKKSTLYFVSAKVTNVGSGTLKSAQIPLYVVNEDGAYIPASTFNSSFKPCPSTALPKKFKPGATTTQCWAYLVPNHGQMTAVSFYPGPWFNPPITWS